MMTTEKKKRRSRKVMAVGITVQSQFENRRHQYNFFLLIRHGRISQYAYLKVKERFITSRVVCFQFMNSDFHTSPFVGEDIKLKLFF